MSTISSLQLAANNLNYISMMFVRCYCVVVIPLGVVGHLLSIYIFTRPALRSNPCSMYFLAAAIIGLVDACYTLPMRMIQSGFIDTDPGAHSVIFCKITWFLLYSIRGLCPWLVALACGDRYLSSSTSTKKRSWSSPHVACRIIPLTIFLGFIVYIHIPFFFKIDIIPGTQQPICYPPGPPGTYRIILSFFNLIYFGLCPLCCMLLCSILTFRNMERSKRLHVVPSNIMANQNNQRTNRNMLRMLFIQVFVYCVTILAYSIATIYTSITAIQTQTVFQVAQENMIIDVLGMLTNNGPCLSFYLFTLSSALFRKELKKLFFKFNQIYQEPQNGTSRLQNLDRSRMTTKT
ncbi:unnamed protein product [Adineta steineri]|uniref:G-protein coupled receptors family 1 profile domain-containing protein n=1 Tax=Adineta steineri TaxID=433720 RepID=A0A813V4G2_9BILA|nr:unnamed protein product [Adineta steineri]